MADEEDKKDPVVVTPAPAPAAAPAPAPQTGFIPTPPKTTVGNIYTDYDPKGALGGLFAPAYLKGFEPSEKALGDFYNSKSHLTDADLESTRMPWDWMAPRAVNSATFGRGGMGAGGMGGDLPEYLAYGDRSGIMDPAALKALAQGTPYDLTARRELVAQKLASNEAQSEGYRQQHLARYGYLPEEEARGPYAGYGGGDPRFGGPGASGWREAQQAGVGQPLFPGHHIAPPQVGTGGMFMGAGLNMGQGFR